MQVIVPSVSVLTARTFRLGAVNSIEAPDASVKLIVVAFTVMDSTTAVEPDTLIVMSFTLNTVSVVKLTSSNAANVSTGRRRAVAVPNAISFLMTCGC